MSTSQSSVRYPWGYPILAALVGTLLALEMFEEPLSVVFGLTQELSGTVIGKDPSFYSAVLLPILNVALAVWAATALVFRASQLELGQRACLALTSFVGSSLFIFKAALWWWTATDTGLDYRHTAALETNGGLGSLGTLSHGLLVILWLGWLTHSYRRRGRSQAGKHAGQAFWGVAIALGAWAFAGPHLESVGSLVVGLTAMLWATIQAARIPGALADPSEPEGSNLDRPSL